MEERAQRIRELEISMKALTRFMMEEALRHVALNVIALRELGVDEEEFQRVQQAQLKATWSSTKGRLADLRKRYADEPGWDEELDWDGMSFH